MSRTEITLPAAFTFSTEITLLGLHINFGGHLDNALLLTLVSEARVRYWQKIGYCALDLDGVIAVVADAALQYKSEAFQGETVIVEHAARDVHKYGFELAWRIRERSSGREIARGKTGLLCVDKLTRKVCGVPATLLARLQVASDAALT